MRIKFLFLIVLGTLVTHINSVAYAFQSEAIKASLDSEPPEKIEDVVLQIQWEDGEPSKLVANEVREAIEKTLRLAIMEQLDASLPALIDNLEEVTSTLTTVISVVLEKRGIGVVSIDILPASVTDVKAVLRLLPEKITEFKVEFRLRTMTPFTEILTRDERLSLTEKLRAELTGTPYTDSAWVEKLVREQVESFFPENPAYQDFNVLTLVVSGATTSVYLTFLNEEGAETVAQFFLKLRSDTLLNLQLETVSNRASAILADLVGLPVSFALAKKALIEDYLSSASLEIPEVRMVSPVVEAELFVVRNELSCVMRIESLKYRLKMSGRVDVNRSGNNSRFDVTAGLLIGPHSDVFFHGTFFPGEPEFRPQLGVSLLAEPAGFAELAYDFKLNSALLRAQLNVLPDFYLSAERYGKNKLNEESEYALTYIFRNLYEFKIVTDFKGEVFGSLGVRI